ncbi:MAG: PSD1 and planctomycete cytochrome C domain-containing protein [Paludisphaera borealis]|uniref:PSD1 and planctomycete cytochrome C domain-containing protein n=1 Tax=Paludisphaera borealis TaxID=1387353 RepID=UPI0028406525|nr:PSD1 and planctomycete cytochrome C domain-containing protein [Paludisphaera borealis]MDR3617934.1 PSD1 and planctomycete cytochrome C domain-containing protein [Paludisphaera borealis]
MSRIVGLAALTSGLGVSAAPPGDAPASPPQDPAAVEFFEKRVRPILVERCLNCHGPTKQKGELRLDTRAGVLAGGSSGPAVEPGKAESSLLVSAINYGELYHMPPKSKLPAEEIEALTKWVAQGATWGVEAPTDAAATEAKGGGSGDGFEGSPEFARRARFWSFQPIRKPALPAVSDARAQWPRNPIDRFLLAAMEERGLAPAGEADRRTLIRRLTYDLVGLPPTVEEVAAFVADDAPDAYEKLVDRLLASPHYGERWGRHWLDLARYAETSGHEFDYDVLNAYQYRDYVVRAFNLDLPYDQFVAEQVAGDLLPKPRRHPTEGFNESILGTGFYFLGEGTHSPVDLREEGVRRIDNQIDVFSKTFLGLTVSCARCHDHKFDPISARDYYALAGFLRSSRHQQAFIDSDVHIAPIVGDLKAIKRTIGDLLVQASAKLPNSRRTAIEAARPSPGARVGDATAEGFRATRFDDWKTTGEAFGDLGSAGGDFRLELGDDARRLIPIHAGELHGGRISDRLQGVVRSPTFTIQQRYLHLLAAGTSGRINVVIDGFEKIRDPIYGGLTIAIAGPDEPRWISRDLEMWVGHRAYIEVCDGSAADYTGARTGRVDGRGSLRIAEIAATARPEPPHAPPAPAGSAIDLKALVNELATVDSPLADRLARALDAYRDLEAKIPAPSLAPAIADGDGEDENLMIRGNPKTLGEAVPRRLLSILGGKSQASPSGGSGRLELAQGLVDVRSNPLLPRVLVNRLWKQHFGEGIVKSTDDFGAMGQLPSHPALLDWLASEFVDRGWSLKALHRLMVGSSAYRMQSRSDAKADELDPNNVLLHRMNVRRLEAEAIRDALLAVSGRLDRTFAGPSVAPHLSAFMDGRGRPEASGPLDGDGRRSLYVQVRRNFLTPMFLAFDAPVPFSTMGRRNVSNVPAQALTLLNDPLVVVLAEAWAGRLLAEGDLPVDGRIERLYETAFGRPPTEREVRQCAAFVAERQASDALRTWTDLCHVLFNVKEFIYVD